MRIKIQAMKGSGSQYQQCKHYTRDSWLCSYERWWYVNITIDIWICELSIDIWITKLELSTATIGLTWHHVYRWLIIVYRRIMLKSYYDVNEPLSSSLRPFGFSVLSIQIQ